MTVKSSEENPEELIGNELRRLPESYYILRDVSLSLPKAVEYRKSGRYVGFCHIDYLVIGYKGIFNIHHLSGGLEPRELLKQADTGGLILYLTLYYRLGKRFTINNIAIRERGTPRYHHYFVRHLTYKQLIPFITSREDILSKKTIKKILKQLF